MRAHGLPVIPAHILADGTREIIAAGLGHDIHIPGPRAAKAGVKGGLDDLGIFHRVINQARGVLAAFVFVLDAHTVQGVARGLGLAAADGGSTPGVDREARSQIGGPGETAITTNGGEGVQRFSREGCRSLGVGLIDRTRRRDDFHHGAGRRDGLQGEVLTDVRTHADAQVGGHGAGEPVLGDRHAVIPRGEQRGPETTLGIRDDRAGLN